MTQDDGWDRTFPGWTPAYGNEKTAAQVIDDLREERDQFRRQCGIEAGARAEMQRFREAAEAQCELLVRDNDAMLADLDRARTERDENEKHRRHLAEMYEALVVDCESARTEATLNARLAAEWEDKARHAEGRVENLRDIIDALRDQLAAAQEERDRIDDSADYWNRAYVDEVKAREAIEAQLAAARARIGHLEGEIASVNTVWLVDGERDALRALLGEAKPWLADTLDNLKENEHGEDYYDGRLAREMTDLLARIDAATRAP